MRRQSPLRKNLRLWVATPLVCATLWACGGGGGGSDDDGIAFRCSDSPVAANQTAMLCGTKIDSQTWLVQVTLGGPTTSADISGFDFDVVFNAANLSYVPGSARLGALLGQDGDDPLLVAQVASNDAGRLIVGVHRTNQPAGVQGAAAENLVMDFCLRTDSPLSAFGPDLVHFENAETVDSLGAPIGSISFSDQLLLSVK